MAEGDKFYQFPLCCLCYGETPITRLDHVISYCIGEVGEAAWEKLEEHQQEPVLERLLERKSVPQDFDRDNEQHVHLLYGASMFHLTLGSAVSNARYHAQVTKHIAERKRRFGRDVEVRIRSDILWDTFQERFPYRDFSVLSAVYSVIGNNKGAVRITREMILDRALGYKSREAVTMHNRTDGARRLTVKELRNTLTKLEDRGFFVRVNPSPRKAYFSNRLTCEELTAAVVELEARRAVQKAKKFALNQSLKDAIETRRKELLCA